jgi:hypothetical protein
MIFRRRAPYRALKPHALLPSPPRISAHFASLRYHFYSLATVSLQILSFAFNNLQDALSATPFLSYSCMVAGGGMGPLALFTSSRRLSFLASYEPPDLQAPCFDNNATVPGHG